MFAVRKFRVVWALIPLATTFYGVGIAYECAAADSAGIRPIQAKRMTGVVKKSCPSGCKYNREREQCLNNEGELCQRELRKRRN